MTDIHFIKAAGQIKGFTVSGHSGYADEGSDIVCAAITTALRLTEVIINDSMGLSARVDVKDARISLKLGPDSADAQPVLSGFCELTRQLALEYPENIRITEENRNA